MVLKTLGIVSLVVAAILMLARVSVAQEAPAAAASTQASDAMAHGGTTAEGAVEQPEGGDVTSKELSLGTLIVTIVIFIVLLVVLRSTAWKPILAGLKSREMAIRESIEAAHRAKSDAERSAKELEAKMAEVQRQAAAQLTQAKADAQKLAETIRAQAEAEATALKDRTLREIDGAKQQALTEINTHAAELGVTIARKILQRSVTVDDQQRLVDESLAALAAKN